MEKYSAYEKLLRVKRALEEGPVRGRTATELAEFLGEERSTVSRILGAYLRQLRQRSDEAAQLAGSVGALLHAVVGLTENPPQRRGE